jgi:hypothetical protein
MNALPLDTQNLETYTVNGLFFTENTINGGERNSKCIQESELNSL